jgi:uncharacterized membrane protein YoaK (UPF0700 family)
MRHPDHGGLPAVLLALTVVTGLIDAASILAFGRVFVANMTGNIVFIGFALVGAPGFSLLGSVLALAGFLVGAIAGGVVVSRLSRRRMMLTFAVVTELVFVVASILIIAMSSAVSAAAPVVVALLAIGLGARNAVVRKLAVPDLTTTVLTMSITGVGADLRNWKPDAALRRILSVVAMLVGAAAGALTVITIGVLPLLTITAVVLAGVLVASLLVNDGDTRARSAPSTTNSA